MKKRVLENKEQKKEKLLEAAFHLFTNKDIQDVTVSDLTSMAGVAKGTFYLYFKDKFELRDFLISLESAKLINLALIRLEENDIRNFEDAVVFLINQVLLQLESNPLILNFIKRNLSWGVFHDHLSSTFDSDAYHLNEIFAHKAREAGYNYKQPDVILAMILELTGSICYSSIVNSHPLPINDLKPYLFEAVRGILQSGRDQ